MRPLLAAQYIEKYHKVPPVLFDELLTMDLDPVLRHAIDDLLERKKATTEGEQNPQIPEIRDFIQEELLRQKAISEKMPDDRNTNWSELNKCFMEIIR